MREKKIDCAGFLDDKPTDYQVRGADDEEAKNVVGRRDVIAMSGRLRLAELPPRVGGDGALTGGVLHEQDGDEQSRGEAEATARRQPQPAKCHQVRAPDTGRRKARRRRPGVVNRPQMCLLDMHTVPRYGVVEFNIPLETV